MPNTPASIGQGVTGLTQGRSTTDEQFELVGCLFQGLGNVIEVPETLIGVVSSISCSAHACIDYLIQQLTATAITKGFTSKQAANTLRTRRQAHRRGDSALERALMG